jgi:hypothetical protein
VFTEHEEKLPVINCMLSTVRKAVVESSKEITATNILSWMEYRVYYKMKKATNVHADQRAYSDYAEYEPGENKSSGL